MVVGSEGMILDWHVGEREVNFIICFCVFSCFISMPSNKLHTIWFVWLMVFFFSFLLLAVLLFSVTCSLYFTISVVLSVLCYFSVFSPWEFWVSKTHSVSCVFYYVLLPFSKMKPCTHTQKNLNFKLQRTLVGPFWGAYGFVSFYLNDLW